MIAQKLTQEQLEQLHGHLVAEGFKKTDYGYKRKLDPKSKVIETSWEIVIMPGSHTGMGAVLDKYGTRDHDHPELVNFLGCTDIYGRIIPTRDCSLVYRRLKADRSGTEDIVYGPGNTFFSVTPNYRHRKHHLLMNNGKHPVRLIVEQLPGYVTEDLSLI
jgi:hypothetical protein